MIPQLSNELYECSLSLLESIVTGDSISPEFDAYITDTAIAVRYSGIIPALLDNENQGKAGKSGLPPALVNRLTVKLLRQFFGYPNHFQYGLIKDMCSHQPSGALLKQQILEILASLKFAAKTFKQVDTFSFDTSLPAYLTLDSECELNVQNFRADNDPARINGSKANLRLAYYSYLETDKGYQSWFDNYGLAKVNENIESNLSTYHRNFEVVSGKLPKPRGSEFGTFELTVGSRGLLVGTGYPHMNLLNQEKKSDFQLGFFFDHSTGLPAIPASSIKGFLRSCFPDSNNDDEYILERLKEAMIKAGITVADSLTTDIASQLKSALFGLMENPAQGSMFFNSFIARKTSPIYDPDGSNRNWFVDEDWFAPHQHNGKRSKLREPNPIRFLKIVPGVVFKFGFLAPSTDLGDGVVITPQQQISLYKELLLSRNFGAKHRTGFGSFL